MSEPMLPLQKAVLFFFLFYLVCVHVGVGGGRKRSHDMAYMWKSEGNFSLGVISPGVLETDRSSGFWQTLSPVGSSCQLRKVFSI